MAPSIVYVLPASSLHGGIRVVLEHADGLLDRGWDVTVVGPEPAPDWHPLRAEYRQADLADSGAVPSRDVAVGTFWTTVEPALASGSRTVAHFCQGYEGIHREYASLLPRIDEVYRLPIPKLLVSGHLEPVLRRRYGAVRTYLLGQFIDTDRFRPGPERAHDGRLRIGIVGPFSIRSKGIAPALEGLRQARDQGAPIEVHRASAEPISAAERALGVVDSYRERLSTEEMVGFYQGLDALLFTSFDEEGFPLPPLEAMACGIAVAVTSIGPFAVMPRSAAERFEPGRPEQVPQIVETLLDATRRAELAVAGLEYARSLRLDRVLDRLEAALVAEGARTA